MSTAVIFGILVFILAIVMYYYEVPMYIIGSMLAITLLGIMYYFRVVEPRNTVISPDIIREKIKELVPEVAQTL